MDDLGLRAYDAQGNFVGLSEYAGQLQTALGGMSAEQRNAAMNTLFGSDAVRAAAVLYEQGSAGVEKWETAVADSGYASRTAAAMTDNLVGDLERLGGSIETALIENGSAGNAVLRELVQLADGAVGVFSDLPGPVQGAATGVAALTGAVSLASGAFLLGVPKVAAFKDALGDMGPRSQRFGGAILRTGTFLAGPWGLALGAGVVALGLFAKAKADAQAQVDAFTAAIERDSGVVGANARAHAAAQLESKGLLKTAEELALNLEDVTSAAIGDEAAMRNLRRAVGGYKDEAVASASAAELQAAQFDESSRSAFATADAAGKLLGQVEGLASSTEAGVAAARRNAEAMGDSGDAAADAAPQVDALGNAMVGGAEKTEEMSDAQKELQSALESWTSPLATYQELVQATAQRTADATEDAADSWEDYKDRGLTSLDDFSAKLEEQNTAHQQWRDNLVKVARDVGPEVAAYLAEMGEDGVMLTAQFANGTAEETARAAAAIRQHMSQGTADATQSLDQGMKVMAAIAKSGGRATAHQIAAELQVGVDQVARIAQQYGVKLATGVSPILVALGRPGILAGTSGRARHEADGGVLAHGGGRENHVAQIARAGEWRVWAEDETGGEAYIPLAPSKRRRSVNIWEETGHRLGVFRDGGFFSVSDIPRPPSTRPFGPPISTAGDRTMAHAYGEAADWVKANAAPDLGQGVGVARMMAALRARFPGLPLISGLRPGAITATGNRSYHGMGRAVDIPPRLDVNHWIAQNYGSLTRELILSLPGAINLNNGRPHRYGEPTYSMHKDHNHWAMARGGILGAPGSLLNPFVRDKGGPVLVGCTFHSTPEDSTP